MAVDWSFAEDRRPGVQFNTHQPERTIYGRVWTQVVVFNWPAPGFTQMTITERCDGTMVLDHGRVYALPELEGDDGA